MMSSSVLDSMHEVMRGLVQHHETKIIENVRYTIINNFVVFPVNPEHIYNANNDIHDIEIKNEAGTNIGMLCLTSQISNIEISKLTDAQVAALVYESLSNFYGNIPGQYKNDYVCINTDDILDYISTMETSAIWGGFCHISQSEKIVNFKLSSDNHPIITKSGISPPSNRHALSAYRAGVHSGIKERFLSLYHCLEIDYDYEALNQIKNVSFDDTSKMWEILNGTQREEIHRLTHLLAGFNDISFINNHLEKKLKTFEDVIKRIFFDYGKASNPFSDWDEFEACFINNPTINRIEVEKIRKSKKYPGENYTADDIKYKTRLIKLTSYFIYRTRCCIAHNKLGDYYMDNDDDMQFLSEFIMPLLLNMIYYRFKV